MKLFDEVSKFKQFQEQDITFQPREYCHSKSEKMHKCLQWRNRIMFQGRKANEGFYEECEGFQKPNSLIVPIKSYLMLDISEEDGEDPMMYSHKYYDQEDNNNCSDNSFDKFDELVQNH